MAFLYFLYFVNSNLKIQIIGAIGVAIVLFIWLFICQNMKNTGPPIKKIVLITTNDEKQQEWLCKNVRSFLIGKGTASSEVDIDLGNTKYSEYINNEHAVLNYSNGFWYIEDLNSQNGVGIKKYGEEYALKLKPKVAYKIDKGDVIYISKTKILVS